jgi:hypothetical protein
LTRDRLALLHAAHASRHTPLPEALADLFTRYPPQTNPSHGPIDKIGPTWKLTDAHTMAIEAGCQSTTQLLTTPLSFCPSFQAYYSQDPADQPFGASYDSYSIPWTGGSFYACPAFDGAALEKAVRWAIASVSLPDALPTLITMAVPSWGNRPFRKWLSKPHIQKAAILSHATPHLVPTHNDDRPAPKTNTIILLISNPSGLQQFYNRDRLKAAWTCHPLNSPLAPSTPFPNRPFHLKPPSPLHAFSAPTPP